MRFSTPSSTTSTRRDGSRQRFVSDFGVGAAAAAANSSTVSSGTPAGTSSTAMLMWNTLPTPGCEVA